LAAIAKDQLISFIEQPELHLHPRAQSRIGDLLIRSVVSADRSKLHQPVMIVETHSEHVALRVLRRIREISGTDDAHNLSEKVIFYYFKKTAGETAVHRIGVDSCGRFVDIWPDGFFEDRVEDLFS
jgi:predicted ATPase